MISGARANASAVAGSRRCVSTLPNAAGVPTKSESRSRNPVTCGTVICGSIRPMKGRSRRPTPTPRIRKMAHRNSGIDMTTMLPRSVTCSVSRPRPANIANPPTRPRVIPSRSPAATSSKVVGSAAKIRPVTRWRKWLEIPKSPRTMWPSQIAYCSGIGRSRPISWRIASTSASVAFGGSDMPSGSAGMSRSTTNTSAETTSRIGIAAASRRRRMLNAVSVRLSSSLQRIALRQRPAIRIRRELEPVLVGDRFDPLEQRDAVALLHRVGMQIAVTRLALRLVGLDQQLAHALAEVGALVGREDRLRVEQVAAIHLGIAGGVAPLIHGRFRQLSGAQQLLVLGHLHDFEVGLDADLLPHLGDRLGDLEVIRKHALARVEADLRRFRGAEAGCAQQRPGQGFVMRKVKILRIAGRAVCRRDGDGNRLSTVERLRDRLLVDRVMGGEPHLLALEFAGVVDLEDQNTADRVAPPTNPPQSQHPRH